MVTTKKSEIMKLPCFNLLTIRKILERHIFLLKWKWDKYNIVSRNLYKYKLRDTTILLFHNSYLVFPFSISIDFSLLFGRAPELFWFLSLCSCYVICFEVLKVPRHKNTRQMSIHHTIWSLAFSSPVSETLYTDILCKQTGSQIIFPFPLFF